MARPKSDFQLTPLELEIMKVLWEQGRATVQAVMQGLPAERGLAYSTVQTMLNLLVKKGKASRELNDRAYVYQPAMERSGAVRLALKDLIDRLFGGSAEDLVLGLVESEQLDPEKLRELHKTLTRARAKEKPRARS